MSARCPGCGHSCCPHPGLECGGDSDVVRACAENDCTCAMTEGSQRRCPEHGEDAYRAESDAASKCSGVGCSCYGNAELHDLPTAESDAAVTALDLHELWLRIHVARREAGPVDSFYAGVVRAQRILEDWGREHGIDRLCDTEPTVLPPEVQP